MMAQLTVNQPKKFARNTLKLLEGKDLEADQVKRIKDTYPEIEKLMKRYEDPYRRELVWLGEKMIRFRGCSGCHEIQGLEDAGKIGAELTGSNSVGNKPLFMFSFGNLEKELLSEESRLKKKLKEKGWLLEHNRWSWFRQKLQHPRSFDYGTPNISYRAKLKMPKYEMTPEEREAIVTFLMGQTNRDLPHELKVNPTGKDRVIEEGKRLINKKNCTGCHRIGTQLRDIELDLPEKQLNKEGEITNERQINKEFIQSTFGQQWSKNKDMWLGGYLLWNPETGSTSFRLHLSEKDRKTLDKRGIKVFAEKGEYLSSQKQFNGEEKSLMQILFLELGFDRIPVLSYSEGAIQRQGDLSTSASPPDLKLVGKKIQSDWLFNFLKNPGENRWRRELPVHMPNFHLTDDEALTLSRYFYTINGEPYPYQSEKKYTLTDKERKVAVEKVKQCYSQCHASFSENQPTPRLWKAKSRTRRKWIEPQPEGMGWLERPKSLEPGTNMNGIVSDPEVQRSITKYLFQLTRSEFEEEISSGK